jgi:hypothetical protein
LTVGGTLQWRNRIDERQSFLRSWRRSTGRRAARLARRNQVTLAASLGAIGGIGTGLRAARHGADRPTVHDRPRPIDKFAASEPIQHRKVNQVPKAGSVPMSKTTPTGHSGPAAQSLGQHLPWSPASQHEQDACKTGAMTDARSTTHLAAAQWPRHCGGQGECVHAIICWSC